jgi:hypothetical protein
MARTLDDFDDLIRISHNLPLAHVRRRNKDLLSAADDANGHVHDSRSAQYDPAIVSVSSAKPSHHHSMTLPRAQNIPSLQTTLPKMQHPSVTAPRRDHPF